MATDTHACRVLIVDDNAGFRAIARNLLRRGGLDVVGEAATLAGGVEAIARIHPDLVLLDVQLPDGNGIDGAAAIVEEPGAPVVVLISSRQATAYGARLLASAARGFIPKDELTVGRVESLWHAV